MEERQARLTVLIDPKNKEAFDALCASLDVTSSQMIRQLIVDYLSSHGVDFPADREMKRHSSK
ncbi:MAG: hypothetical protein NVSMB34_02880 [Variovorax sp.]